MLANILIRSSAIITAPIFTRLLTTSDYGIASNFAAWLNIGLVVVGLGLPFSIGNAKMDFPSKLENYLASIQTLGSIMAAAVLIFVILFRGQLSAWMELDQNLVIVIAIFILFQPSVTFAQERYKFILKYKENIYISIVNTLGAILFCLIFILFVFNDARYFGRIIGLIFPMFLMGVFFYIKILHGGWNINIKKYWAYALKLSLPMIPHALAMIVLSQMDRIMIIKFNGSSDAGLYSFGFSYAVLLLIFSNAIMQAYSPWLYISYQRNDFQSIKSTNNIIAFVMCVLTLIVITMAPEALKILGSKDFWDAKWVVMPIAIGALFQYVYNMYSGLELYHKKTSIIAIGTILAAILNYFLNNTFIPIYGYIAAAYATFASYFALALFHLFFYEKVCKKRIYDDKYIWVITIITVLISFLIMLLYEYFLIRYFLLIVFLLIIGFFQKEKVKTLYNLISNQLMKG